MATRDEPEYFMSQSTHTFLSVVEGEGCGAVVGLARLSGEASQQWFPVEGRLQWGKDRSLCLDVRDGRLVLVPCGESRAVWRMDSQGRMGKDGRVDGKGRVRMDGEVLDVPWEPPRRRVITYPPHDGPNQKWWRLSTLRLIAGEHKCHVGNASTWFEDVIRDSNTSGSGPEYLVSQSSHTCLSVVSGSGPDDAVIAMAACTHSPSQQWCVVGSQWQWGSNQCYCLVPGPDNRSLALGTSHDSGQVWSMDEVGVFGTGGLALDVPWEQPRTQVILYPRHAGKNQRWWRLSNVNQKNNKIYPLPTNSKEYEKEIARGILNCLCPVDRPMPYAREVADFPGCVSPTTPRTTLTVTLDLSVLGQAENLRMTCPQDWQVTGSYAVAGEVFHVHLPDTLPPSRAAQISVRVGAHCDVLDPSSDNVKQAQKMKRCPTVSEEFALRPGKNALRSQYGGNLIFMFAEGENFKTKAEIHNTVKAPHYILGQTSNCDWNAMKELDIPFTVLEGNKIVVIAPTKSAKKLTTPDELLRRYDDIIGKLNFLSGFSEDDPPPRGKQWLVQDVQISCGSAHAGFPVMFDGQYYDIASLVTPHDWVTWHELGHNYQQPRHWSYTFGSESTVNLFSCFIEEELGVGSRLEKENRYKNTAMAVKNGLTFAAADCWQKLVFLMEIRHAFPASGWDLYRTLNKSVRALSKDEAKMLEDDENNQIDFVYKCLSLTAEADLIGHFKRWGVSVSPQAEAEVAGAGLRRAPADLSVGKLRTNAIKQLQT